MKRLIDVTRDDLDHGQKLKCFLCPVARAINRYLKPGHFAGVGWLTRPSVYINLKTAPSLEAYLDPRYDRGPLTTALLPTAVPSFVSQFDHGRTVFPFSFELDIPDEVAA